MITTLTFLYMALALLGGFIGARLVKAKPSAGVYSAGAGFLACVAAQLNGATAVIALLTFMIVALGAGLLFKLRPLQIAGIIAAAIVVSVAGSFLIHFSIGFEEGFMKAFTHAAKP